jgi:molybdopterin molybdotransferase
VRLQGADSRVGECILAAGTRLDAPQLGLLASVGRASVRVVRKPRVAIFTTGNELIEPGEPLPPGKIFNANHPMLVAALHRLGVEVLDLGCLPDEEAPLRTALAEAAAVADLVITSGGVSVGDADLVRKVVSVLGRIDQWRVFLKPGKPLAFGVIAQTPFIGLPGNPVSTFITFFGSFAQRYGYCWGPIRRSIGRLCDCRSLAPGLREIGQSSCGCAGSGAQMDRRSCLFSKIRILDCSARWPGQMAWH